MRYTKKQFAMDVLKVEPPRVSALLNQKKIIADKDGLIDEENPVNAKYLKEREITVRKFEDTKGKYDGINVQGVFEQQSQTEKLEAELLEQKVSKERAANTILALKLAKEKKEIVETDLLNKIVMGCYDALFKNLLEYPNNIADELIDIARTSEAPRTDIINFLTLGIGEQLKKGLSQAEETMLRVYEK